ncbi:MAG: cytidylate kinase-like family protein [Deltaproteobacteria bacterium]|nr:cytidylate kinase-like family protein [Deltaproteobacteria bacterium]
MTISIKGINYVPGTYAKKKPKASILTGHYIKEWDKKQGLLKAKKREKLPPSICFSRKIGVGALEIADLLAEKTGYPVFEREIIEHMADDADLNKKTINFFDEHYPGKLKELAAFLFAEKSYVMSDYVRNLFRTVLSLADIESSIFVGRGTHLILPRDRVLAVRLICSREYRCRRLAAILNVDNKHVEGKLDEIDKEQRVFFKKVFHKQDASPYEFDLCINCDYIKKPQTAVDIIHSAFMEKFASDLSD